MTINKATNINDRVLLAHYSKILKAAITKAKTDSTRSRENKEFEIKISIIEKAR